MSTINAGLLLRDISLSLGGKQVLKGIDFSISGKACLLGPNGSGKTSLLSAIADFAKSQRGSIMLNRMDLLSDNKARIANVGAMIQRQDFNRQATAFSEMHLIARLKGDSTDIRTLLRSHGIEPAMRIAALPHGKYSLLKLLQAMLGKPSLLLLDEPFSGLDIISRRQVVRLLKGYLGMMLITSHTVDEISELCDEVLFIKEGRIIKKCGMRSKKELEKTYVRLYS